MQQGIQIWVIRDRTMSNDRLYTEKEISKILKRAGEIQASEREKVTMGLSLEELQQLAEEVGLEPDIIANVAETIDIEPENEDVGFLSSLMMPTKIDLEHVIQGEISEDEWPEVVAMMERHSGKAGSSSQVGKLLEWTAETNNTTHKLSLIPGTDQTKLIYQGVFSKLAMSWTIPIVVNVGFWTIFLAMLNLGMIGIPIGLAATFITYLVILRGFKNYIKKKKNSVRHTFIKLKGLVSKGANSKDKSATKTADYIQFPDAFDGEENLNEQAGKNRVR